MHFAKKRNTHNYTFLIFKKIMHLMVKKNAVYLVTEAVILSKQLKGKYELLLPAQIFFFSRHINRFL